MQKATSKAAVGEFSVEQKAAAFNFNKLQAVLCMSASAVVSIGLIVWAVSKFF